MTIAKPGISVLHFRKQLTGPPVAVNPPGIEVRNFAAPGDVPAWLALRDLAMANERPRARPWTTADFHAETTSKPWWSDDRSWAAVSHERADGSNALAGVVTLAVRSGRDGDVAVVHWLLVDPAWRRRGVARLLMTHLELAAWNAGWREVQLETHSGWSAAVAFYQSIGYAVLRDRSPR